MAEDRQERKAPQKPKASEEQKQTSAVSALPTTPQTLNPGEKHTYPLKLKANDYLKLTVEQQGIDVVVRLVGPDGKTIQEVDSPNGTQGPEPLSAIVEQAGNYILEIEPLGKTGQPGKYELNLESIKTANEQDKKEIEIKYFLSKALTLESSGKYQDALLFARQAFDKSKMLNDPLLLSDCYTVLAINYFQLKDIRNAEQNFLNALEIRETVLGPDHPFVALILNRLALLYKSSLRYSKAEPMYLRALTICEKTLGPSDDQVRVILNNLALLYDAKGDYAKAELFLNRSLEISEPNNPISLNNLARFC